MEIREVKWEVLRKCRRYEPGGDRCDVCLAEKLSIMKNKDTRSLNRCSELMNTCRHHQRQKLAKVKER